MFFLKSITFYFLLNSILPNANAFKLKYTLTGSNGTVRSLTVLENGYLASGSDDSTLRIWDLQHRGLKFSFNSSNGGHSNQIRTLVSFGKNLASGSLDGSIKIWSFTTEPRLLTTLDSSNQGHADAVLKLLIIKDTLISSSADCIIKVWDIKDINNITLKNNLLGHDRMVSNLLDLENNQIASASADRSIKLWDLTEGKLSYSFDSSNGGHETPVGFVLRIGSNMISSSYNIPDKQGDIRVFDLSTKRLKFKFNDHTGFIFDLITLDDLNYVASASDDKTVKIWDVINGRLVRSLEHQNEAWSLIYLGQHVLVSGAGDYNGTKGELNVWDLSNGDLKYSFDNKNGGHEKRIYSFLKLYNGDLVSGSVDRTIKVWDTVDQFL